MSSTNSLTIEDLGSSNGTFVNGERIESVRVLSVGDVVRLGQTELEVTDAAGRVPEPTLIGSPAPTQVGAQDELVVLEGPAAGQRLTLGEELPIGRLHPTARTPSHSQSLRLAAVAREA